MNKSLEIAQAIAAELTTSYKEDILSKAESHTDIDGDDGFWDDYKGACMIAFEKVTGREFFDGEKAPSSKTEQLMDDAEYTVFDKRFFLEV